MNYSNPQEMFVAGYEAGYRDGVRWSCFVALCVALPAAALALAAVIFA